MREKRIYLLLTDTKSLLARAIKSYTKKPYSHASLAFDKELIDVYSFGRKTPRNPFHGGFVKEDIQSDLFYHAQCGVYALSVTDKQYDKIKRYIENMYKQKDKFHYNLLGLFGLVLNKPVQRENTYFCSQFVAKILEDCDIMTCDKDASLMTPHDLLESAHFETIYEGDLREYCHRSWQEDAGSTYIYEHYPLGSAG